MTNRSSADPDLYVLDALANDVEDLENILRMLNSDTELGWVKEWGRPFSRADVVAALTRLVRADHAFVVARIGDEMQQLPPRSLPPDTYDDVYFGMTDRGRLLHSNWEPNTPTS